MPLSHPPGHAQCDFGEALVIIGGVEQKAHCFVLDLPHSDGCFVKAYPAETTVAFLDGHVSGFAKRMDPLRSAEAELASKKKEAERQLDQQATIIAQPATVHQFAVGSVAYRDGRPGAAGGGRDRWPGASGNQTLGQCFLQSGVFSSS